MVGSEYIKLRYNIETNELTALTKGKIEKLLEKVYPDYLPSLFVLNLGQSVVVKLEHVYKDKNIPIYFLRVEYEEEGIPLYDFVDYLIKLNKIYNRVIKHKKDEGIIFVEPLKIGYDILTQIATSVLSEIELAALLGNKTKKNLKHQRDTEIAFMIVTNRKIESYLHMDRTGLEMTKVNDYILTQKRKMSIIRKIKHRIEDLFIRGRVDADALPGLLDDFEKAGTISEIIEILEDKYQLLNFAELIKVINNSRSFVDLLKNFEEYKRKGPIDYWVLSTDAPLSEKLFIESIKHYFNPILLY